MTHYIDVKLQDLMTATLQNLVDKLHLENQILGDVALGAIINSSTNWNLARECVLGTRLDPHTPAYNLQRACGTSLEAARQIALKISTYQIENGIAGGCDSNSDLPVMIGRSLTHKLLSLHHAKTVTAKIKILASLRPTDFKLIYPAVVEPRTHLSMGEHCEKMVKEWHISRQAQDELALKSHQNGVSAYHEKFYDDLVFEWMSLKQDTILRDDTSIEKLSKLKTAFDFTDQGTLTAGNSSPLTDGAAAVFLASEDYAKNNNYPLLARFVDAEAAAVDFVHGEGLLMAPTLAVNTLLKRNHLTLQDFDFYEIHEAFAGQVLCTLKAWESTDYCRRVLQREQPMGSIDRNKMNIKGGSVALGHPFAATGARIVGSLAKMLHQKGSGKGLISICTAGGMGVAAILEAV
jgi:acetyl-CoA C-acetyltransferase